MAIRLQDKANVNAPTTTYPYGSSRNNPGDDTGTPLNMALLGDYLQFFARMLELSSITPNGVLDNASSGFQYYEAFIDRIRNFIETEENIIRTEAIQTQAVTTDKIDDFAVTTDKIKDDAVDQDKIVDNSIDNQKIINGQITREKIESGHVVKTPEGSPQLLTRVFEIGGWDMDSDVNKNVMFPLDFDGENIRSADVLIQSDTETGYLALNYNNGTNSAGHYAVATLSFVLNRVAGGIFDNNGYSNDEINRGYITIVYEE